MKRGIKSFQDEQFRIKIVESLKAVDKVFLSIDKTPSVCESLEFLIKEAQKS
jgi:glycerol-3-phosphate cytidylyltransferase-like family protein